MWRIFVVAHPYNPTAYPPDHARVLRLMHRVARYFAACAANAAARGDPRSLCFRLGDLHAVQLVPVPGTDVEIV